jgi:hypothetical protein
VEGRLIRVVNAAVRDAEGLVYTQPLFGVSTDDCADAGLVWVAAPSVEVVGGPRSRDEAFKKRVAG